jgi:hypothetical protein
MSALSSAKTMLSTGEKMALGASADLPPCLLINFQFKLAEGEAENLDKAGQKWREVSEKLQKTSTDLQDAIAGVPPETWTGDDRTAYEQQIKQVCEQLEIAAQFYLAVGIALTVFAYALLVFAVFALGMGIVLDALAVAAAAALASVVGAPAYAGILEAAATCLEVTWGATAVLAGAGGGVAVVFQGGAALTALLEYKHGDKQALNDFKKAEEVGAVAAVANLAQNAANAGLAYAGRGKDGSMKIDLDADRDKNKDWQLGAGVDNGKYGGAVHARYGKDGFEEVDVSGHAKRGNDDIKGKAGYEDDDGFGHGKSGTVSADVSDTHKGKDGSETTVDAKGSYNTETHDAKGEVDYDHKSKSGTEDSAKVSGGYNSSTHEATGEADYTHKSSSGSETSAKLGGSYNTETHATNLQGSASHGDVSVSGGYEDKDGIGRGHGGTATGEVDYTHKGAGGSETHASLGGSYNTESHATSLQGSVDHGDVHAKAGYQDQDGIGHGHGGTATGEAGYTHKGADGTETSAKLGGSYNTESHATSVQGSARHGDFYGSGGYQDQDGIGHGHGGTATGEAGYTHTGANGTETSAKLDGSYNTDSGDWSGNAEGGYSRDGTTVGAHGGYDSMGNSFYAGGTVEDERTGYSGSVNHGRDNAASGERKPT